jgi:hypothetical protein
MRRAPLTQLRLKVTITAAQAHDHEAFDVLSRKKSFTTPKAFMKIPGRGRCENNRYPAFLAGLDVPRNPGTTELAWRP